MGLLKKFLGQCRRPEGILGSIMLAGMDIGHASVARWGLGHLDASEDAPRDIVDLGCGGGQNVGRLLEMYPSARAMGIDHSPLSVAKARARHAEAIAAGRCAVEEGDVSALALEAESFDLATAFETVYFWPGLEACFAQVARILRPGGRFLIVDELDGRSPWGARFARIIDGMRDVGQEEIEAALRTAGFGEIVAHHHPSRSWLAVLARK